MSERPASLTSPPDGYADWLADLKGRIHGAQQRATLAVNRELVLLYWQIGRDILARQAAQGWGAKVIDRLAHDLRAAFPAMKGFSPRNLKYMRAFAEAWPEVEFVQAVLAQLPWYHQLALLDKLPDSKTRRWYAAKAIEHGWSRNVLVIQIETRLLERTGTAVTNFELSLPKPQSDLARESIKDPYRFDFLGLTDEASASWEALSSVATQAIRRDHPLESTMPRRILFTSLAAALLLAPLAARAFPDRPIEWVVPYPAGGGSDVVARTLAEPMAKSLGQAIVVVNKPGAATNIGADYVAKAKADGHVLLTADTATLAANPSLYAKLPYSAEKDLAPVGLIARFPMLLVVNPAVPVKNYAEFLAWARQQGAGANYATPGAGSPHHLATELLRARSGLALVHVPYRGAAPAVQDVIGGQLPFMFVDTAAGYPHILAGRLRAIGVASPRRVAGFETVPTLAEQGLAGFEAYAWQGLAVPAATPPEAIAALSKALRAALDSTPVKARFQVLGLEAIAGTPAQMAAYAKAEREKWGEVIRAGNIRLD